MKPADNGLSRREFAKRAALGTAAVASGEWRVASGEQGIGAVVDSPQVPTEAAKLSPQSQAEAEARYQAILAQYPDRFSDAQKADLKRLCFVVQQPLDGLRAYSVSNADQPALYLKPLVEREKKTNAPPNLKAAAGHSSPVAPAAQPKPATNGKP